MLKFVVRKVTFFSSFLLHFILSSVHSESDCGDLKLASLM